MEVTGKLHIFYSNDHQHIERKKVFQMVRKMDVLLANHGFTHDLSWALEGGSTEEKKGILF